ncbi:unnamed protein product [Ilex paraguariensis]|uniref:Uncharacterized protein n=1 Tax=Ilex paraguariensis TaxID=185542 RepID=A0ABC8SNF3_9AQUA
MVTQAGNNGGSVTGVEREPPMRTSPTLNREESIQPSNTVVIDDTTRHSHGFKACPHSERGIDSRNNGVKTISFDEDMRIFQLMVFKLKREYLNHLGQI